jgi:choline dehydrogenase-like flavoprotein
VRWLIAKAIMPYDCDVIVIGSGAGGGTFAGACAMAGKSVLLIERGRKYVVNGHGHDERAMLIDKKPYDDRPIRVNGEERRTYTGGVFGGSTAVYGGALMRPSAEDFYPGKYYGDRVPSAIWEWPVNYDTLEPYYSEAEKLYGVAGSSDDDFGPLGKPARGFPQPVHPIRPINRQLMSSNGAHGLKPFRLPLAIDFRRCLQCNVCPGYVCPNGARQSSAQLVERVAAENPKLRVVTDTEVEGLCKDARGRVAGVRLVDRTTGRKSVYRARKYALAAGAIASPILLLRSGIGGPLVGRNYMFHLSPLVAGVFLKGTGAEGTFVKQVGFADYYLGTKEFAHKLGIIQSLPVPGPLMLAKVGSRRLPEVFVQALRKRMLPLVGIVEDLPNPENRVTLSNNGAAELHHSFCAYDIERGRRLTKLMIQILRRAGALFCLAKLFPSHEHLAHQCGTLRFGKSPADAVLDTDCRMFEHPDVFVVDGSFFPTSLGVGPALTIMANALRVAGVVVKEI